MRLSWIAFTGAVFAVTLAVIEAQGPTRGRPPAAPLGATPTVASPLEFLLRQAGVADDLGLSDGQRMHLGLLNDQGNAGEIGVDAITQELDLDQIQRFLELMFQWQIMQKGLAPTLLSPEMIDLLQLAPNQITMIAAMEESFLAFGFAHFFSADPSRELDDQMRLLRHMVDDLLLSVLTPEQLHVFAQLYGADLQDGWPQQPASLFGGSSGLTGGSYASSGGSKGTEEPGEYSKTNTRGKLSN